MELKGKIIAFLGDSITEGVGVKDIAANRFDHVMEKEYGLAKTYNFGIGGSRLAHQSHPSEKPRHDLCFCGRAYDIPKDADVIVVYGGVNDYFHGDAPIGQMGDTTPATFCGAVYFLMKLLKTDHPNATVVFLTPARCIRPDLDDIAPSTRAMKLPDAKPLLWYAETIQKTAEQFGIPVLDFYHNLGIDPHDPEMKEKYTADGLHFNDLGHHVLAGKIAGFLQSL